MNIKVSELAEQVAAMAMERLPTLEGVVKRLEHLETMSKMATPTENKLSQLQEHQTNLSNYVNQTVGALRQRIDRGLENAENNRTQLWKRLTELEELLTTLPESSLAPHTVEQVKGLLERVFTLETDHRVLAKNQQSLAEIADERWTHSRQEMHSIGLQYEGTQRRFTKSREAEKSMHARIDEAMEDINGLAAYTGFNEFSADLERAEEEIGDVERALDVGPQDSMLIDRSIPDGVITHPDAGTFKFTMPAEDKGTRMRRFQLQRYEDETGISGTGIVAEGVQFADGSCALSWLTHHKSIGVYPNIVEIENIHGHGGRTVVVYLD